MQSNSKFDFITKIHKYENLRMIPLVITRLRVVMAIQDIPVTKGLISNNESNKICFVLIFFKRFICYRQLTRTV